MFYVLFGYVILHEVQLKVVKREIKRSIKNKVPLQHLTKIVIHKNNQDLLNWKDDHEFKMGQEMFDIVYFIKKADTTIYFCINDKQEKKLFENLEKNFSLLFAGNKNNKNSSQILIKALSFKYTLPSNGVSHFNNYKISHYPNFNIISLNDITLQQLTPPPQILS